MIHEVLAGRSMRFEESPSAGTQDGARYRLTED
jgi:hypothetical protein